MILKEVHGDCLRVWGLIRRPALDFDRIHLVMERFLVIYRDQLKGIGHFLLQKAHVIHLDTKLLVCLSQLLSKLPIFSHYGVIGSHSAARVIFLSNLLFREGMSLHRPFELLNIERSCLISLKNDVL